MKFSLFIGFRYLISKKTHNVINIISWVSVVGIGVTTAALIIVLSIFNGLESLISSLYSSFDPDINITAKKGKTFSSDSINIAAIANIPGVLYVHKVIEDNVLLKKEKEQIIATFKGVEDNYFDNGKFDNNIIFGDKNVNQAIIGYGISYFLNIPSDNFPHPVTLLVPKRKVSNLLNPTNAFYIKTIPVGAVFSIQQEIDDKYIFIPFSIAKEMLLYDTDITSLEIIIKDKNNYKDVQKIVNSIVGENYQVKNHFEMQDSLYKVMKSEKIAIYFILTFIIIIAAFNIISSLTMLIINKEKDISIFSSMGASLKQIKKIFALESLLLSSIGVISGLFLGFCICLIQLYFHVIKFGQGGSFIIDYYPVKLLYSDFLIVFATVLIISILAAIVPIIKIKINHNYNRK